MTLSKKNANLTLLFVAFMWGSSYSFIKQATLAGMRAGTINMIRGAIFAFLIYLFFHKTVNKISRQEFKFGLIAGLINFGTLQFQTLGIRFTTPSNAAFLTATYVIFVPFIAWIFLKEKPKRKTYIAVFLCLVGMVFLTGIATSGLHIQTGDLLAIMSAIVMASQITYYRSLKSNTRPIVIAFMVGVVQMILSSFYSGIFEMNTFSHIRWHQAILPVITLGVTASFAAQTLQIVAQRFTDAISAGLILMTESLFASILSVILGFEKVTSSLVIGGSLILIALLLMQGNLGWFKWPAIKTVHQAKHNTLS